MLKKNASTGPLLMLVFTQCALPYHKKASQKNNLILTDKCLKNATLGMNSWFVFYTIKYYVLETLHTAASSHNYGARNTECYM